MRGRRCFMFVMNVDIGIRRIIDLFVLAISYLKLGRGGAAFGWLLGDWLVKQAG